MNLDGLASSLAARMHGRVETNISLAPLTTYRLGGPAALVVEVADEHDLGILSEVLAGADPIPPLLPMGRGSNLVVSDVGFEGIVIRLGRSFSVIEGWDPPAPAPEASGVVAGGAVSLPQLANRAARLGLAGLEWAVGVPGSVGGGVRMNAGAHDQDVAGILSEADIWRLEEARVDTVTTPRMGYGYRRSNVTERDVVLRARFALTPEAAESIKERTDRFRRHRALTQPGALQNAGSVFKNPPGDHAGRLVEAAGLKGFSVGGATVSDLHANFFLAPEGTTAQEVFDLVVQVRERVRERFGIDLQPEIRFIGAFEERASVAGGSR